MLRNLFNGRYSVTSTFWGGYFGFNITMRVVFLFVNAAAFDTYTEENEEVIDFLLAVLVGACSIYCALLAHGMYRAMYKDRDPSIVSWIGLILILVGVLGYSYNLLQIYRADLPVSKSQIDAEIRSIQLALPEEIEPGTDLVNVSFTNGVYRFRYQVDGDDLYDGEYELILESGGTEICSNFEGYFAGPVERLEMVFQGTSIRSVGVLDKATCLEYLKEE
ncbi:MAG: hypothetical protein P1U83_03795 [Roseovarius sp.]|nr:hypothetical protein [Roseovarius sp.]